MRTVKARRRQARTRVRHLADEIRVGRAHRDTLREELWAVELDRDRLLAGLIVMVESKLQGEAYADWVRVVGKSLIDGRRTVPDGTEVGV
jgi:hypothetical protein